MLANFLGQLVFALQVISNFTLAERIQHLEVFENVPPGTRIGYIEGDSSPYLVVPVPGSSVESDLIIDQATGEISTRVSLDREKRDSYSLVSLPQNIRVIVHVLDENDNSPSFSTTEIDVVFPENAARDLRCALPYALDPDIGQFSTQRYDIVSGNVGSIFRLSQHRGRDGVLYLDLQSSGVLDYETQSKYKLLVEALDGGLPPLSARLLININIQDMNDNPPIFQQIRYKASVLENSSIGTTVLTVSATDADSGINGQLEYYINRRQSDRDEIFRIDHETGIVYVNRQLDFEICEQHEIVLVARDRGVQSLEATAFLSVYIVNVNDNQPSISVIFLSDDKTPKISESAQPGDFVARVSVSDPDSHNGYSNVTVSLKGGGGHFDLITRDSIIYLIVVNQTLDREVEPSYELSLKATDTGMPPLQAISTFRLLITDINDNAPHFIGEPYKAQLFEAVELGSSVLQVLAKDLDDGLNGQVQYNILSYSNDGKNRNKKSSDGRVSNSRSDKMNRNLFTIDKNSGLITVVCHLECETNSVHILVIVASDLGEPALSSSTTVQLEIYDANNSEPILEKTFYNATIPENTPQDTCFLKVSARDTDCGVNSIVNYSLATNVKNSKYFTINSNTGEICLIKLLDRETTASYELALVATDKGGLSAMSMVRIFVSDINDNRPIFQPDVYTVTLNNIHNMSEAICRVSANDMDDGIFGQITYTIGSGDRDKIFRIDKKSGEIYLNQPFIVVASVTYLLNITAYDTGGIRNIIDAIVKITIISTTDNMLTCDKPRYIMKVAENVYQNTSIGSLRNLNIPRNTENGFYFLNESSYFHVDANTGKVYVKRPLDREFQDHYLLSVEIKNSESQGQCQVEVIVEDANDNTPTFLIDNVNISIAESFPLDRVFYVAYAIDMDLSISPLQFSLSQNNENFCKIDVRSGEIVLVRPLDYEIQQHHRFLINVNDEAGLLASVALNIKVQDVNDNLPVFDKEEYYIQVSEGMITDTKVIQITAVDLDTGNNARLTYQLEEIGPFQVNANNGWITLANKLDRETINHYNLTVLAIDSGILANTARACIFIDVIDENDNVPSFKDDLYVFEVSENLPSGTVVGQVQATDEDTGKNAFLKYTILSSNNIFSVNPDSGVITTSESLDREKQSAHEIIIEARDQGTYSQASRVPVKIYVLDVNDNSPEIINPQDKVVSIREGQPTSTEVTKIVAVDKDLGDNSTIKYFILQDPKSDGTVFSIDSVSGIIRTESVLDYEDRSSYTLSIKAMDGGKPSLYSIWILRVDVLALTDSQPISKSRSLTFRVSENSSVGDQVGSICKDSMTRSVIYYLTSQHPFSEMSVFEIDNVSGQLVIAYPLDRELCSEYYLEIQSMSISSLVNLQETLLFVKVIIEDSNDNPPCWSQDLIIIEFLENTPVGSNIYNLSAIDLDVGVNSDIRYYIKAAYPNRDYFHIDIRTGFLTLSHSLDREDISEFILIIGAVDQALLQERHLSSITVRILVLDENDNDPVFVAPRIQNVVVGTDILSGTEIMRVIATDADLGNNSILSYSLYSENDKKYFTVGLESGVLSIVRPIQQSMKLVVVAHDHGQPSRQSKLELNVTTILSSTKKPLRLLRWNPTAKVSECLNIGSNIINVSNTVASQQENISYSILDHSVSNFFSISKNGTVKLEKSLNREDKDFYVLTIVARTNKILDLTTLKIIVLDENDNSPEIKSSSCFTLTVPENQETDALHTIIASDMDEEKNGELLYSIIGGNIGSKFKIDSVTGVLSMDSLDREYISKYILTISVRDNGQHSRETFCNLTVIVLDENDNAPTFLYDAYTNITLQPFDIQSKSYEQDYNNQNFIQGKYSKTISENVDINSSILRVKAVDYDQGLNAKIVYSIANESTWLFQVNNSTGIITTKGALDRERRNYYFFLVIACDSGRHRKHQTSVFIEIFVQDVNDNYPVIEKYYYTLQVSEFILPGQDILKIRAYDPDDGYNGEIVFTLLNGQDNTQFSIHPQTGVITALLPPIQKYGSTHRLNVIVKDKGITPLSTKCLVELKIGNVSDSSPFLKFQNDCYQSLVYENISDNSEIIQVTALMSDGRRPLIHYSIESGNERDIFSINGESGVVKVRNSSELDADLWEEISMDTNKIVVKKTNGSDIERNWMVKRNEDNSQTYKDFHHRLTLVAKTIGLQILESYVTLFVKIINVNDNAPIFTQSQYTASVLEGHLKGSFVIRVSAYDMDNDLENQIVYHIVDGNQDNAFIITPPYSGIVRTNIVLDREIKEEYYLTVIATDKGDPPLTGTSYITVQVVDINDNQPTFPELDVITIFEDTCPGTVLATISANDVDSSPALVYHLVEDSNLNNFRINPFSGTIILTHKLDAESCEEYNLLVSATDGIHEVTTLIIFKIMDVNDNTPYFKESLSLISVTDDQDSLKEIACITAFDHDLSDENNGLTYYLAHLTRGFTMNPISGRLFMNCTELLRPLPKEIVLEIVAKDSGKPSLNAICLIIIRLTEPGNNILDKQHSLAIKENATVGTVLMALSDIDLVNAVITATDGIGVFEISEERIILVKSLDRETKERYFIQLDSKNENSTKAFFNEGPVTVVINISDVNDNHPHFTQDLYQVVINEDTLINTTIIRVQAKDSDYGYNLSSAVKYTITSGNDANFFKINQLSGSVWVNRNLDFDLGPELHYLTIMACDSDIINPLCTCTRLLIKLEDVNDNLPIFPVSEYFKYISENEPVGTKVFTAHAFDYDRSIDRTLNYSILSTASYIFPSLVEDYKLFSINAITGVVTTKNVFDYEKKHHYVFTICATDNGGHTATAKINIDIESRDEFYPQFTQRLYRFDIKRDFNISASISIGNVKATDEDMGPDGNVIYHFLKHDPFFKLNRTTGELALKMKLGLVDTRSLNFYKLYVCANSGRKNSLSNITVVEIFIIKNVVKQNLNNTSTFPLPPSKDINLSDSTDDSLAYWISLFFTFFLLLVLTVISIFIYFNTLYQNNKDLHEKSMLSSECSPAMISSYTNSSVFHSIAIKNNIGIKESDSNSSVHKVSENEATCQFLLPKYDEIPLYRTSIPRIQALSESSTSIQSGSSGHGSAEDDDEDDAEINSFDDEQQANEMTSDLLVNNTKEYLARLGIVDSPINILREPSKIIPLETLRLIEVETTAEAEFARLLCGKIRGSNRSFSDLDIESLSINRSFSSIVYREEDLIKLYDWNNFIYSELQYQSLAHVFHEIAALQTYTNNEVNESSNYYVLQVTPSLTSVPTTTLNVPIIARTISPRLPITYDNATFQSVALCPSFSPSLSPLTTRTSSVSPLVPTTSRCHRTTRGISINATNI